MIDEFNGLKVGGINVNQLQYTDDTALIAESETDLQTILDKVTEVSPEKGFDLNTKKTECMVTAKKKQNP